MKKLLAILLIACIALRAGQMLFDFETAEAANLWTRHSNELHRMEWTETLATSGNHALRYQAKKWSAGMPEWPSFEVPSPLQDWTDYDRLVLDITNVKLLPPFFAFYISDSNIPVRQSLLHKCVIEPFGSQRIVVPLKFPNTVNIKDIRVFHLFTQRPEEDYDFTIDRIMLLRPGEEVGSVPGKVQEIAQKTRQKTIDIWLKDVNEKMSQFQLPEVNENILNALGLSRKVLLDEVNTRRDRAFAILRDSQSSSSQLREAAMLLQDLPKLYAHPFSLASFAKACQNAGLKCDDMLVGTATSMEKVLPRDVALNIKPATEISISLARNEREAAQVIVLPLKDTLKHVSVAVKGLRREGSLWTYFPKLNVEINTVGYVETKTRPPYTVSHVGWWPDPLLDFCTSVDIQKGDAQAFWIRVRASENQLSGIYRGELEVTSDNAKPFVIPFSIQVYDFTLPKQIPLPTAISWNHPHFEKTAMPQRGGAENWPKMKYVYADFLTDYLVDWGNIYIKTPPDFEVIQYLHDKGHLTTFCLGDASTWDVSKIPAEIERLRPLYNEAKKRNLLKYAYIYAYDECQPDKFPIIEACAKALHEAFPEVLLMTTSYDHSFGQDTVVKSIDAWCPLTPRFDLAKVKQAHDAGRYVWWYICCGPQSPYANWFIEYPAIEIRQLMGATTAKYQPDGFLYYSMTIWNNNKPILSGPFTDWNPVSWTTYHGDGCIFDFGKDGYPVPTIRLENYRDGLEDYAYHCILKYAVAKMSKLPTRTPEQENWLKAAQVALVVPDTLVKSTASFSRDPKDLTAWRQRLARLIEASGFTDLDPWRDSQFDVRGWRK